MELKLEPVFEDKELKYLVSKLGSIYAISTAYWSHRYYDNLEEAVQAALKVWSNARDGYHRNCPGKEYAVRAVIALKRVAQEKERVK